MAPLNPFPIARTLAFRPHAARPSSAVAGFKRAAPQCQRFYADKSKDLPIADQPQPGQEEAVGPNMRQQEHVSEEAAKQAKIMGQEGPDIEQGTPVQDILKEDKEAREQAPKVMQESIKAGTGAQNAKPPGSRSFSTLARRQQEMDMHSSATPGSLDPAVLPGADLRDQWSAMQSTSLAPSEGEHPGHKFPLPELPIPKNMIKDERYDPIVSQVTNLLMVSGKKAAAQRNMAHILSVLRTAPPPKYSANRPLMPGAPPASHLPLNPTMYLTLAIDSVAPLLRIRSQRGAAGGGVALQIPVPLGLRQRRRQAITWIVDAASKRKTRGSGKYTFAQRVAEELIAVIEGRSGVWDKRGAAHKLGTTARSNLNYGNKRRF